MSGLFVALLFGAGAYALTLGRACYDAWRLPHLRYARISPGDAWRLPVYPGWLLLQQRRGAVHAWALGRGVVAAILAALVAGTL